MRTTQQLLRRRERLRSAQRQIAAQVRDRPRHVVGHVRHQSHVQRGRGVERLTGEVGGGQLGPPAARQDRSGDDRRSHADPHFGERERDRPGDDHEIARGHQPDAAGADGPVDGGDHGRGGRPETFDCTHERCRIDDAGRPFLEIGTGTEDRRCVRQHDHPGVGGFGTVQRVVQFGQQLLR